MLVLMVSVVVAGMIVAGMVMVRVIMTIMVLVITVVVLMVVPGTGSVNMLVAVIMFVDHALALARGRRWRRKTNDGIAKAADLLFNLQEIGRSSVTDCHRSSGYRNGYVLDPFRAPYGSVDLGCAGRAIHSVYSVLCLDRFVHGGHLDSVEIPTYNLMSL